MSNPFATALVLACAAGGAVAQTTWYVDVNASAPGLGTQLSPYASIQYAIDRPTTLDHDTIVVAPGTYFEGVRIDSKWLTVRSSAGPLVTTIRAQYAGNVVYLDHSMAVVEGFTITGHTPLGPAVTAAVYLYTGTIRGCILRNNSTGVWCNEQGDIVSSTIAGNGIGINCNNFGCFLGIADSIVASNSYDLGAAGTAIVSASYSAGFNSIFFNVDPIGPGTIVGDPQLWNVSGGDFHLAPGSPCIDAGNPNLALDPDGSRRDIGALTYDASYAPAPAVYCTAKTNSLGCVPAIGASGHASASGAPFTISCTNELNHKLGLLFYGHTPQNAAYQGGYLCISSPVKRTSVIDSLGNSGVDDCSGVYTFDFDAQIQSGADPALVAGEVVYAQFWSRDPNASFTTNRSDAISFGIAP